MHILNLTQHPATNDQIAAGVIDLPERTRALLQDALTFNELPMAATLQARADSIAIMAAGHSGQFRSAMIGGAPYFMPYLERALWDVDIRPLYAFSRRESVERLLPDGTVEKVSVFKHAGFIGLEFAEPTR